MITTGLLCFTLFHHSDLLCEFANTFPYLTDVQMCKFEQRTGPHMSFCLAVKYSTC